MARIPDQTENRRQFAQLGAGERRAVIKSVNRGRTVPHRRYAVVAVGVARRQQRFWRWSWLIGPAMGLVQVLFVDPAIAVGNAAVATMGLLLLSIWFGLRARRAEQLNLEVAEGRRTAGDDRVDRQRGQGAAPPAAARPGGRPAGPGGRRWPWSRRDGPGTTPASDDGEGAAAGRRPSPGHLPRSTNRLDAPEGQAADGNGAGRDAAGDPAPPARGGSAGGGGGAAPRQAPDDERLPPGRRPYQPRGRKRRRRG